MVVMSRIRNGADDREIDLKGVDNGGEMNLKGVDKGGEWIGMG